MAVLQADGAATKTISALAGSSRPEKGQVEVEQVGKKYAHMSFPPRRSCVPDPGS